MPIATPRPRSSRCCARRGPTTRCSARRAPRRAGSSGLRWIIDPLDGTVNFLYAQPSFAVSIACEDAEGTLVGVVHQPLTGETFTAIRGGGAWRDGERLAVNRPASMARALVATGFSYEPERRALQGAIAARLLPRVRDLRRAGSAALDLAWVACGRLDGYYEHGLNDVGLGRRRAARDARPEAACSASPPAGGLPVGARRGRPRRSSAALAAELPSPEPA